MEVWQWILVSLDCELNKLNLGLTSLLSRQVTLNVVSTIPIPSHVTKEEEEGMMNGTVLIL